uniref:(northern house mosquito) hypothetical protein n=1 Tax=Culex pipiens TaxID=7175 RepID=A0A8D8EXZ3_CULPI
MTTMSLSIVTQQKIRRVPFQFPKTHKHTTKVNKIKVHTIELRTTTTKKQLETTSRRKRESPKALPNQCSKSPQHKSIHSRSKISTNEQTFNFYSFLDATKPTFYKFYKTEPRQPNTYVRVSTHTNTQNTQKLTEKPKTKFLVSLKKI